MGEAGVEGYGTFYILPFITSLGVPAFPVLPVSCTLLPPCALTLCPLLQAGGQDEDAVLSYLLLFAEYFPTSMWYPADFLSDYKEPSGPLLVVQWLRFHALYRGHKLSP